MFFIVAPIYWGVILNKQRKAKPIINNNPTDGNLNLGAPLLTSGETDNLDATNGYAYAALGQPCNNSAPPIAIPNLPESYTLQPCNPVTGLKCVDGIYEGSICLSDLGFYCDSLNDCVPQADACLNNICSSGGDTLNQKCENDNDCQILIQYNDPNIQQKIYNHVCQIETNKGYGYCKVNSYPFDSGCNSSSECNGDAICSNQLGKFNITVTNSSNVMTFTIENSINWSDLTGLVALVFSGSTNKGIYQVSQFNTSSLSGTLITSSTNVNVLASGLYTISFGQGNKGICLESIPVGGPANMILGGISIPCQNPSVNKNIKGYCLPNDIPNIGDVCIFNDVDCPQQKIDAGNGNVATISPDCLYNDNTEQIILNDYYYGLSPASFATYKIGNCTVASVGKEQLCDNLWFGCLPPYLCIQENNQSGKPVSICNTPFQAQICLNNQCPDGYVCDENYNDEGGLPPLCLSLENNMCFQNSDCLYKNCGNYAISYFNPITSKSSIITNIDINSNININDVNFYISDPGVCAAIPPNSTELTVPKKIIYWYPLGNNKYSITMYENNNTKTIFTTVESNMTIKDVIVDEDENVLVLYKNIVTETMRERSFPITSIQSDNTTFNLPDFNGLVNGINVFYVNTNNPSTDILDTTKLYTLVKNINFGDSTFVLQYDGNNVNFSNIPSDLNGHYIATYDNKYANNVPLRDDDGTDGPLCLCANYNYTNSPYNLQITNGDSLTFTSTTQSDPDRLIKSTQVESNTKNRNIINYSLDNGAEFYAVPMGTAVSGTSGVIGPTGPNNTPGFTFSSGITPESYIEYVISQGYYHSVGGYPIIDNYKVVDQRIFSTAGNDYFKLNANGYFTYGMTVLNFDDYSDGEEIMMYIGPGQYYIYDETARRLVLNGSLHYGGMTYLYNGDDDEISINSKKIDGINYLIINKGILYSSEYNNTRYVNHFLQIKYSISLINNPNVISSKLYKHNLINGTNVQYVNISFEIVKTIAQNQSNGFHYANVNNQENNIDYINLNSNDTIFYTLNNNNSLNNKGENSLGINSKYSELYHALNSNSYLNTRYQDYPNFEDMVPLDFSDIVNVNTRQGNENYFIDQNNFIYIYNEQDIENILNFSSSELVLTKEGSTQTCNYNDTYLPSSSNPYGTADVNFSFTPQITWCLVNIVEYDVTVDGEYMKIKIQVNIPYEDIKDIITSSNGWKLHVYNFVPLNFYPLNQTTNGSSDYNHYKSYIYQLSDASLLFTASKGNSYYKDGYDSSSNNNKYGFSRTGYNSVMIRTGGKNSDNTYNSISTNGSEFSIYVINDGAAVLLEQAKISSPLLTYYVSRTNQDSFEMDPTNNEAGIDFYKSSANASFIPGYEAPNISLVDRTDPITPSKIPYAYTYYHPPILLESYFAVTGNTDAYYIYVNGQINDPNPQFYSRLTSFSNGRFFCSFAPITKAQFENIQYIGNYWPMPDKNIKKPEYNEGEIIFSNVGGSDLNAFSQFVLDSGNVVQRGNNNVYIRKMYGGAIRLPYANYINNAIYAVNNLFSSSLPNGPTFKMNTFSIIHDYIVTNYAKDKDGNSIIKNLGNISLYQTYMAHYQTGTNKSPSYFNETNQIAISWPEWLKVRYVNRSNEIPKIRKVIINTNDGNNYANSSYYAFVEYNGETNLVYLNSENLNYDLSENQGVPSTVSIFTGGEALSDVGQLFKMIGPDKLLYYLSKVCAS